MSPEDNFTTLKVYRRLQELRRRESFQWGEMCVFREGDLLMYTRKAERFPGYLVAVNLRKDRVTIESLLAATGIPKEVKVVFHTHKKIQDTDSRSSENSYLLGPSQGVVLEYPLWFALPCHLIINTIIWSSLIAVFYRLREKKDFSWHKMHNTYIYAYCLMEDILKTVYFLYMYIEVN